MGVASCRIIFLLSDVVFSRVCCLVSFQILLRELNFDLWLCVPRGFDPRCGPARLGLGPRALPLPMSPPSPSLLPLIQFSCAQLPLSPTSLSLPHGALGFRDADHRNLDPRGEPPPLSLLPLLPPLPHPTRPPPAARPPRPRPAPPPSRAPRAPPRQRPAPPPCLAPRCLLGRALGRLPGRALARRLGPEPAPPASPAALVPPARAVCSHVRNGVARHSTFSLICFSLF
jgi:hypothetical protein